MLDFLMLVVLCNLHNLVSSSLCKIVNSQAPSPIEFYICFTTTCFQNRNILHYLTVTGNIVQTLFYILGYGVLGSRRH